jgi:23S rRNA pseudouridine1911/1915/1917 synthase
MAVVDKGKESRTAYRVLKYPGDYTLLEVIPKTGRTHQIRVHLSAIGHAVAGDSLYGGRSLHLPRQFLHASRLGFHHPTTRKYLEFTSSLPVDLKQALADISRTR